MILILLSDIRIGLEGFCPCEVVVANGGLEICQTDEVGFNMVCNPAIGRSGVLV